jgi:hypothetical protein
MATAAEIVAGMLAGGAVRELAGEAGGGLVAGITARVRAVFGSDARSADALQRAGQGESAAVTELASALAWYAKRDETLAGELVSWAGRAGGSGVRQTVRAGRDVYAAGGDQSVRVDNRRPGSAGD